MGKMETHGEADGAAGERGAVPAAAGESAGAPDARASREALRRELEAYWRRRLRMLPGWTHETAALRAAVHDHVGALRLAGAPPERVLVAMKEAVLEVTETQGPEAHTLIDQVVRWSIESYFPGARP